MSQTIRVEAETRAKVDQLRRLMGISQGEVVALAVESYRRKHLLAATDEGYAALRAAPERWAGEQAEREAWDTALADGLED